MNMNKETMCRHVLHIHCVIQHKTCVLEHSMSLTKDVHSLNKSLRRWWEVPGKSSFVSAGGLGQNGYGSAHLINCVLFARLQVLGTYWNLLGTDEFLCTWRWPNAAFSKMRFSRNVLEPPGTLVEPTARVGQTRLQLFGTYWNLLGTCSVRTPGPNQTQFSRKCNSHRTFWNLFEPLRNLCPAWAEHDFSFSEPTGTCSEPIRFYTPGLSQTQLSQKCILKEPTGTLPEPWYFEGSLIRNHYFPCSPVLQYILLNKSTGDPPQKTPNTHPTQPGSSKSTF